VNSLKRLDKLEDLAAKLKIEKPYITVEYNFKDDKKYTYLGKPISLEEINELEKKNNILIIEWVDDLK
jgi:HAMP domain-containing protein